MFQFKFKSIVKVISFTSSGVRLCESVHNHLNSKLKYRLDLPCESVHKYYKFELKLKHDVLSLQADLPRI